MKGWCKMANKSLFQSQRGAVTPVADTVNEAGGTAYQMSAKAALAQYVCTGCLNGTFYTTAQTQLDTVRSLLSQVEPEFIAKLAVYAHEKSFMKDLPALLITYLASDAGAGGGVTTPVSVQKLNVLRKAFPRVIDSGNMLRNFFQMIRSAAFGRKSFGEGPRKLIRDWFEKRSPVSIFHQSIGNDPSLADIIKLTKPKPNTPEKAAVLAYLLGAEVVETEEGKVLRRLFKDAKDGQVKTAHEQPFANLPETVRQFEDWKKDKTLPIPAINFRFLDNEKLSTEQWADIASKANWLTTLKSLNTYAQHGVFGVAGMTDLIAARLSNAAEVEKSRVFPYQIMMAYLATDASYGVQSNPLPVKVREAIQDAMELACKNVPVLGKVKIFPDVSGSMKGAAVTGDRGSATSKVRCIDVAALYAAATLRTNREAEVIPFEQTVRDVTLNPRDTVMTNATKLAAIGGGGTNCSAPLQMLNQRKDWSADVLVYISDYESWVDRGYTGTGLLQQWNEYKSHNPKAKLVCIDLTPRTNHQVKEHEDILQVGGFSDNVFTVIAKFVEGGWNKNFWVNEIENLSLEG
jgi:60 kDa SS-A/Ro ribonucleoprotein